MAITIKSIYTTWSLSKALRGRIRSSRQIKRRQHMPKFASNDRWRPIELNKNTNIIKKFNRETRAYSRDVEIRQLNIKCLQF